MTPERFGPYLLLKKLSEDPLGEVFRAGRVASGSLDQVVLLRVLNGSAIDGRSLWPAVGERAEVQEALRNPNIGSGVDLGEVQGLPYVAYDYVSGKNLGVVLDQIVKRSYPMPADHALLLGERLALGLAVAHETRARDGRVVHGFLVPPLVMLSSEGETRILGFEVGPAIRAQLAESPALRAEFGRYLSPEAQKGAAPSPADDIYSLGTILLELLLGHSLPSPLSDDYSPGFPRQVEHVAQHGPKGVGELLGQSLAPAGGRLGDVVSWHKALTRLMVEGGHKSTTFNLAFFMHSLFRDDIERETEELAAERGLDVSQLAKAPPVSPARTEPTAAPKPPPSPSQPTASEPLSSPETGEALTGVDAALTMPTAPAALASQGRAASPAASTPPQAASVSGRRRVLGPTLALVLILLGAAGKWLWDEWQERRARPETTPVESESIPAETQPTTSAHDLEPGEPDRLESDSLPERSTVSVEEVEAGAELDEVALPEPGPDPDELMARLDQMVDERTRAVEEALRSEYDREIEELRSELEAARDRTPSEPAKTVELVPTDPPAPSTRSDRRTEQRPPDPDATPDEGSALDETARSRQATEARESERPGVHRPETEPAERSVTGTVESEPAEPTVAANRVVERVRLGELVEPGPGVVPPSGVECPPLEYPPIAQRLGQETVVVVRVLVDEDGDVRQAKVPQRYRFGFDDAARENARKCKFVNPPTKNGVRVRMWHSMGVRFQARE